MCAVSNVSSKQIAQATTAEKCLPSSAEAAAWNKVKDLKLNETSLDPDQMAWFGAKCGDCSGDLSTKLDVIGSMTAEELGPLDLGGLIKKMVDFINEDTEIKLTRKVAVADRIKQYLNEQSEADLQKLFKCQCPKESILENLFTDEIKNAPRPKSCGGSAKLAVDTGVETAKAEPSKTLESKNETGVLA